MRELKITCPTCEAVKNVNIPKKLFTQKKDGCIKIQIPPGIVCPEHQFIVFLDQNGSIRGYEKIDLVMSATPKKKK